MAAVTINQGITSATPLAEVPLNEWAEVIELRRKFCQRSLPTDCRLLLGFVEDGRVSGFAGYSNEDEYIREGLGLDPEATAWAIHGLEIIGADVPVPFKQAVDLGRQGRVDPPRDEKGRFLKGEAKPSRRSYGETSAYLEARLRRDHPEILAAKERGEYRSIKAAARAAGIVKATFEVPEDVEGAARVLRRRFGKRLPRLIAKLTESA